MAATLVLLLFAWEAAAAPDQDTVLVVRNRLVPEIGAGLVGNLVGDDGHYEGSKSQVDPSFRLGYAHRLLRGLELGGSCSYWYKSVGHPAFHTFLAGLVVRPFAPLGTTDSVEVGGAFRVGGLLVVLPDSVESPQSAIPVTDTWLGAAISGGPDVRLWANSHWAVQVAADFTIGIAQNSNDPMARGLYLHRDALFVAIGLWLGGVAGF